MKAEDLIKDFEKDRPGNVTRRTLNEFFTDVSDYVETEEDVEEMNKAEEYLEEKYLKGETEMNKEEKMTKLSLMDRTASRVNDEEVYEYWLIYGIPDGSTPEEFEDYVEDYEEFELTFKNLMRLAKKNGGLYNATEEEFEFAKRYEPEIGNIIY